MNDGLVDVTLAAVWPSKSCFRVNFSAFFHKLVGFLFQTDLESLFFGDFLFSSVFANVLCDFHAAEVRSAHRAEVRGLGAFLRQRLVVKLARGLGIEREIELIFPTKFEAGFADGVVAVLRAGMAFGQIGGVGGDFVGDDPVFDVFLVRQSEMFFRCDVTKHGAAVPTDHGRADRAGDVIVTGRDVGGERPESVERRFVAPLRVVSPCFP